MRRASRAATVLISKMITAGAVIEVAVPIGDVGDAIVRQGGNAERIVIHRHGDVGKIDIEPARRIGRGRMVQAERAVKRHPDARAVRRIDRSQSG